MGSKKKKSSSAFILDGKNIHKNKHYYSKWFLYNLSDR